MKQKKAAKSKQVASPAGDQVFLQLKAAQLVPDKQNSFQYFQDLFIFYFNIAYIESI